MPKKSKETLRARIGRIGSARKPTKVIMLSFLAVILCGTLLLMLPIASRDGHATPLLGAAFTATSATCVTGLVVFDTYTKFSTFGQVVILLLIQIGGLGLVTLTTFFNVFLGRHLGFKSMQLASESINISDASKIRQLLRVVMTVALTFESVGAVLLCFAFVPRYGAQGVFIAVFIAISAFCNAGFDVFGRMGPFSSLTGFSGNPYVLTVVAVLIISGGLGFLVWQDLASYRKTHHLRLHTKIVLLMTAVLILGGTVGIAVLEWHNPATLGDMSLLDKLMNAFFQSVTTRTAGFNSIDLMPMSPVTKMFMIVLMFVGAAPGGTGGGVKVTTVAVLAATVISVVQGRPDTVAFRRRIPQKTVYKSLAIFMLSLVAMLVSSVTIFYNTSAATSELSSVFEATSAFATVGLSMGATALMRAPAQIITMVTMFIGRVGPVSLAISLSTYKDETHSRVIQPQADLPVG